MPKITKLGHKLKIFESSGKSFGADLSPPPWVWKGSKYGGSNRVNSIPMEQMSRPLLRLVRIWPMVMLVLLIAFLCWFSVPVDHKLISSTSCWLGRRKNVDKSGRQSTQLTRWCKPSRNININIIIVLVTMCNCQCWGIISLATIFWGKNLSVQNRQMQSMACRSGSHQLKLPCGRCLHQALCTRATCLTCPH